MQPPAAASFPLKEIFSLESKGTFGSVSQLGFHGRPSLRQGCLTPISACFVGLCFALSILMGICIISKSSNVIRVCFYVAKSN